MAVTHNSYVVDGWGVGEVWVDDAVLVAHDLRLGRSIAGPPKHADADEIAPNRAPKTASPNGGARPPTGTLAADPSREGAGFVSDLCRRFAGHLAGETSVYHDVTVEQDWCTPFQAALLEALRAVPWGEVVTYGELAALAGRPGAARAAGSFCASNRFALVVPCHRVVAAAGIGGYGATGVRTKRRLLAVEGVRL